MKPTYKRFSLSPAVLALMALLTGCHDKSVTAQLQEEVDKTAESLRTRTIELENLNKSCNTLAAQLRDFGSKKDEMAAETARSSATRKMLSDYRAALSKELAALTDAVAKYRREQVKP